MVIKSNSGKVTKIDSRLFNKPNLLLIFFYIDFTYIMFTFNIRVS